MTAQLRNQKAPKRFKKFNLKKYKLPLKHLVNLTIFSAQS